MTRSGPPTTLVPRTEPEPVSQLLETAATTPPADSWSRLVGLPPPAPSPPARPADRRAAAIAAIAERLGNATATAEEHLPAKVQCMTRHGSKGLSAQMVFIPGPEEEILPGEARRRTSGRSWSRRACCSYRSRASGVRCELRGQPRGKGPHPDPSRFTAHIRTPFVKRTEGFSTGAAQRAGAESAHDVARSLECHWAAPETGRH
jgi:hypothetical protein